jgi:hypothetical protein
MVLPPPTGLARGALYPVLGAMELTAALGYTTSKSDHTTLAHWQLVQALNIGMAERGRASERVQVRWHRTTRRSPFRLIHQRSEGLPRRKPGDLFGRNLHRVPRFRVASDT